MSEEELIEIIKDNMLDMKASIDMNAYFEINTEKTKEFYFAIATIVTLKQKQKQKIDELKSIIEEQQEQIKALKDENDFLRSMYKGTEEYKAVERYASGDHIPRID